MIEYKKEQFQNGLRVISEIVPNVHSVSVGIWVMNGSRDEQKEISGVSHFIEHLLFKGTKDRDSRNIAFTIDSIGGQFDAFTTREYTCLYVKALSQYLDVVMELLSDILLNSTFDGEEFLKEKQVIMEEIKMSEDMPDDNVHDMFFKTFWGDHGLGRPILGTMGTIEALTPEVLKNYFKISYQPQRMIICVVGDFKNENLMDLIKKNFTFEPSVQNNFPKREEPVYKSGSSLKKRKLEQVHFCIGMPGLRQTSDERFVKYALNLILGGSISSRLFQKIREEKGLVYTIYSFFSSFSDAGILGIYGGASPGNIEEILKVVMHEFDEIIKKGISSKEMKIAKNHLKANFLLALENTSNRMSKLAKQEIYFDKFFTIEETLKGIDDVRKEDVQKLSKKLFRKESIVFAATGPLKEDLDINKYY